MKAIEAAVAKCEHAHSGQICVAIEAALPTDVLLRGLSARDRAIEVFSTLRVWDTEHNNGVLLYLLIADRDVEIVADRGIAQRVQQSEWEAICRQMESAFSAGHFEDGIIAGIYSVADKLSDHFPGEGERNNELPDAPVML